MYLSRFVIIIRTLSSSMPASYANSTSLSKAKMFTCIREFVQRMIIYKIQDTRNLFWYHRLSIEYNKISI